MEETPINKVNLKGGSLALIRSYFPTMSPSNKKVAEYILNHPEITLNLAITQVARNAAVSPATVSKFCSGLGYSSFQSFKSALRVDLLSTDHHFCDTVQLDDPIPDIVQKVFDLTIQGLKDTLVTLDHNEIYRAAEAILNARCVCYGPLGLSSSGVAAMLSQKLLNIGIVLMDFSNPSMAYRYIATLQPKDVVLTISHSGISKSIVNFLEQCREQGATVICITNYMDAPITRVSDIRLITAAGREAPLWGEPIAVRPSQVALIDALYTVLSIMKYKRENHEPRD